MLIYLKNQIKNMIVFVDINPNKPKENNKNKKYDAH